MKEAESDIIQAAAWLDAAKNVLVFTGAGISAESGVPTFRDDPGLWSEFPMWQFATWPGLLGSVVLNPRRVAEFLLKILKPIILAEPNAAHRALCLLEQRKSVVIATQNIDGLHQLAGSLRVIELHGSLYRTRSFYSNGSLSRTRLTEVVNGLHEIPTSRLAFFSLVRVLHPLLGIHLFGPQWPDVILFGQRLPLQAIESAMLAAAQCDCALVVGTSGVVYPAAQLPSRARSNGAKVIGIGPERPNCDLWLAGSAGTVLPALVNAVYSRSAHA